MNGHSQQSEIPTLQIAAPGRWVSLQNVGLRADGMVVYEFGELRPNKEDGRWRTDDRSRTAIEAFSALDLAAIAAGLEERRALAATGALVAETWDLAEARKLRDFLMTFGPVGVGRGARFPVNNSEADRWEAEARAANLELAVWRMGRKPDPVRSTKRRHNWSVSFEGWAQGYHGTPPDVTRDSSSNQEPLFRLRDLQRWLAVATTMADSLAVAQHWSAMGEARNRVRDLFLEYGGRIPLLLDGFATEWRRAMPGVPADVYRVVLSEDGARPDIERHDDEPAQPRSGGPWAVDWMMAGRMLLADLIGRHVQWAQLYVAVSEVGRLQTEWLTKSLEELMYLQLMEHVQRRPRKALIKLPYWPIPKCGYCGGVILGRPKRPDGRFANRWHSGRCRKAGQMARLRI